MLQLENRINNAFDYIRSLTDAKPVMGIVLGSGLGDFCDRLKNTTIVPFGSIPDFPVATVENHRGEFIFGNHCNKSIVALRGRLHYYEGYTQQEITMPVRIMKKLGVSTLLLTNAAGGINLTYSTGALMLISDHLNFSGSNPLIGQNLSEFGLRFPDMSDIYSKALREELKAKALKEGIMLEEGVYAMYSGPSFETPAEIRFFRSAGADAVGMSTAPEAIIANHCGIKVIGVSCITNMAAGVLDRKLSHTEVTETAARVRETFIRVVELAISLAQ